MKIIAILGYGKMGRGIYSLAGAAGFDLAVYTRDPDKAEKNNRLAEKRVKRALRDGDIDEAEAERRLHACRFTARLDEVASSDLIIESIVEDFELKRELLRRVEPIAASGCVLASNTSTMSIRALAEALDRPDRFCGLHFFHPVQLCNIVEIIRWPGVRADVVERLETFCRRLGKTPLVFEDTPGSAINSILACYYCEGLYLLEQELALPSGIDRAAGSFCRIGPCESLDVIGLAFFADSFERMRDVRPPQLRTPRLLARLLAEGRAGKAAGGGVYRYEADLAVDDDPALYADKDQNHSEKAASPWRNDLDRRLLYSVICGILYNVSRGLGSLSDLSLAAAEVLGMDRSPLDIMRKAGRGKIENDLREMNHCVGARFDPGLLRFWSEEAGDAAG